MIDFITRVQSEDNTLYQQYTTYLFDRYIKVSKFMVSVKSGDYHAVVSAQAEYKIIVQELRAVMRKDDPRNTYVP